MSMVTSRKNPSPSDAGSPGLRERNKQEKLERIRAAALALFAEKGFGGTTTREVAERAGVATGTLFLYARTKEELLLLVFAGRVEAIQEERFRTLPSEAPLLEQLLHVFTGFFAFYAEDTELSKMLIRELLSLSPGPATQHGNLTLAFMERLGGLVAAAQTHGEVAPEVVPQVAAFNFFSVYLTTLMAWLSGSFGPGDSWRPMLESALLLQLRGLGPGTSAPTPRSRRRQS
jgi:AcrR family transcriptional regulator